MPIINSFNIDTSDLTNSKTTRSFIVKGEPGFEFMLQVVNDSGAFYNFKTKSFSAGYVPSSMLKIKSSTMSYNNNIVFPASTSATYNVILIAPPDSDTTIDADVAGGSINVLNKPITQVGDVVVTFAVSTANTASYGDATTPADEEDPPAANITSTGVPSTAGPYVTTSWSVYNRNTDANGYGLRLIREPVASDWYFTTQDTVNGAVSSSRTVIVDDLTDLVVGMYVTAGTGLSGTPTITEIGTSTKTLVLSSAQSFDDGITLTFQARGTSSIFSATGLNIGVSAISARGGAFTQTVRANVSNNVIVPITNTYGIAGGSHVTVTGVDFDNSSTNNVNSVAADAGGGGADGTMTMDVNQTLTAGTILHFVGSHQQIDATSIIKIAQYPTENRTVYLNLDNFITPGAAL